MFAAVEPKTGASVALQAPTVNTETMSVFLKMLSRKLRKNDQAVLIMDQAGWHKAKRLVIPANITVLYLPPYSPELNPMQRLWSYLRSHFLSNRAYENYDHMLDEQAKAWQTLTPTLLKSVCACPYLSHV